MDGQISSDLTMLEAQFSDACVVSSVSNEGALFIQILIVYTARLGGLLR